MEGLTVLTPSLDVCPGEAPTLTTQLGCTRLCTAVDSSTSTAISKSLTEEMAGEAHQPKPVAAEPEEAVSPRYFHPRYCTSSCQWLLSPEMLCTHFFTQCVHPDVIPY